MGKGIAVVAVIVVLVSGLLGCGSASWSAGTSGAAGQKPPATPVHSRSQGVGQSAPVLKVIVARRTKPWRGRRPGSESALRRWHRTEARLHAPACKGADLVISAVDHSGVAAGTVYSKLTITNVSRRPCTVAGVPRVAAIDRHGRSVGRAEAVPLLRPGSSGRRLRVRLRGEGSVAFTVTHYDGIGSGRCKLAHTYGLRVTVPGTGSTQVVPLPLSYCPSPRGGLGLRVGRIE